MVAGLGLAGARAAQWSCERAVNVMRRARLRRAGAVLVSGAAPPVDRNHPKRSRLQSADWE
jgi:hypothetical protein